MGKRREQPRDDMLGAYFQVLGRGVLRKDRVIERSCQSASKDDRRAAFSLLQKDPASGCREESLVCASFSCNLGFKTVQATSGRTPLQPVLPSHA